MSSNGNGTGLLRRLPIASSRPVVVLAWTRLGLTLVSLALAAALGFPPDGRLAAVLAAAALPWSLAILLLTRRAPERAASPLIAIGDLLMLAAIELAAPETYAAVRFVAIAFVAVHAYFHGARPGLALAAVAAAGLTGVSMITGDGQIHGRLLVFYEVIFTATVLATAALLGGFRAVERASRLRERDLARRTMRRDSQIRRQISDALHDGPIQEMVGLDMTLAAAQGEAKREGAPQTGELLAEARVMAQRSVRSLRDEMIDLGPYAFKEMAYGAALEHCQPLWERRYGLTTNMAIDPLVLPSQTERDLFRITQEAVMNAVKHGSADHVSISLRCDDRRIELSIVDDGDGFPEPNPLDSNQPGHIGLASMRERAELLHGSLRIESTAEGSAVIVDAPLPPLPPRAEAAER